MPLSEHEQRQLEQIEQALYAEHPRLARAMRAKDPRVHYRRRVVQAAAGFLIGAGGLVAGLLLKYTWLSAAGFAVMIASGALAVASYRRLTGMVTTERARRSARSRQASPLRPVRAASAGSFMERLEERWRRRQEGGR